MSNGTVNKVIIVGNLGNDPEIRYMPNGQAVANLTVATTESWKDQQGVKQEKTEWHRITMYRRLAEIAGEYLRKGSKVYLEGQLQTRKWQDQSGQDRYTTEVIASEMQMLGGKDQGASGQQQRPANNNQQGANNNQQSPQQNNNQQQPVANNNQQQPQNNNQQQPVANNNQQRPANNNQQQPQNDYQQQPQNNNQGYQQQPQNNNQGYQQQPQNNQQQPQNQGGGQNNSQPEPVLDDMSFDDDIPFGEVASA